VKEVMLEGPETMADQEIPVMMVAQVVLVLLDLKAQQADLDRMVPPVTQVDPEDPDSRVMLVAQVTQEVPVLAVLLAKMVSPVVLVLLDPPDKTALPVNRLLPLVPQVNLVNPVKTDSQVAQEDPALKDHKDPPVKMEAQELLDSLDNLAHSRDLEEITEAPVPQAFPVKMVSQVLLPLNPDPQVKMVLLVTQAALAHPAKMVSPVDPVVRVTTVVPVVQVLLVNQVSPVVQEKVRITLNPFSIRVQPHDLPLT